MASNCSTILSLHYDVHEPHHTQGLLHVGLSIYKLPDGPQSMHEGLRFAFSRAITEIFRKALAVPLYARSTGLCQLSRSARMAGTPSSHVLHKHRTSNCSLTSQDINKKRHVLRKHGPILAPEKTEHTIIGAPEQPTVFKVTPYGAQRWHHKPARSPKPVCKCSKLPYTLNPKTLNPKP